jgi:sensor histidine kinase YesM
MFQTFGARLSAIAAACIASSLFVVALISFGFFRYSLESYDEAGYESYTETMRERLDTLFETVLTGNSYFLVDPDVRAMYRQILNIETLGEYRSVTARIDELVGERLLLYPTDLLDISVLAPDFTYNRSTDVINRFAAVSQSVLFDSVRDERGAFVEIPTAAWYGGAGQPSRGITFAGLGSAAGPETAEVFTLMTVNPAVALSDDDALDIAIVNGEGELIWRFRNLLDESTASTASQEAARSGPNRLTSEVEGTDRLVFFSRSRSRDWTYVFLFETRDPSQDSRAYAGFLAASGLAVFLVFGLLAVLASRSIVRPLQRLKEAAVEVSDNPALRNPSGLKKVLRRLPLRLSLRMTLVLLLGGITVSAIGTSILFSQLTARERLTTRIEAAAMATLRQRRQNIGLAMNQVERQSAYLAVTASLQDLNRLGGREDILRREIDSAIDSQRVFDDLVTAVDVYSRDGSLLYASRAGSALRAPVLDSLRSVPVVPQGNIWMPARLNRFDGRVITFVRHIRSRNDLTDLGFLFVGIDEREIAERIAISNLRPGSLSFMIDSDSNILAHENPALLGRPLSSLFTGRPGSRVVQIDDVNYRYISVDLDHAAWRLVDLVPGHYISSDLGAFTLTVLLAMLPVVMIMLSAIRVISGRLSRPLEQMARHIDEVSFTVLGNQTYSHSGDEVHQLASAFDTMLTRLDTLIEERYVHEIRERELETRRKAAELKALQFQINPHFLYNTFASVSFLIKLREVDAAVEMVHALTILFRKAASSSQIITVADELAYVDAYLTIIRMRHQGQIRCSVSVPREIGDASILKFTLQPLIENAVMHGILEGTGAGTIELFGSAVDDRVVFTVTDDGTGLSASRLDEVRHSLAEHEHGTAIGLTNVLERLRLYYGETATLAIENGESHGCVTTISIPWQSVPVETRDADA